LVTLTLPQNNATKNTERKKAQISQLRNEKRALRKSLKSKRERVDELKLENQQIKRQVAELSAELAESKKNTPQKDPK
jgi:regulator of replication initiation timing